MSEEIRYRGYHDIGGLPGGPVQCVERPFEDWQKLSEAIRGALEQKDRSVSLDEIRRVFESFGEDLYETLGFYERRAEALTILLAEKDIVAVDEVRQRMDAIAAMRGLKVDHVARTVTPEV
ncbi:nitrile hydratase [Phreatobacter sp.]|uniref:nitrile hydratase n=1 Tax=Phreatobacter sp. TaxID=1966341 RepID=UPI003F707F2E